MVRISVYVLLSCFGYVVGNPNLNCQADGYATITGVAGSGKAWEICAKNEATACGQLTHFRMKYETQSSDQFMALGFSDQPSNSLMNAMDIVLVDGSGSFSRRRATGKAMPQPFGSEAETYGLHNMTASFANSFLQASWSRDNTGAASGVIGLDCCFASQLSSAIVTSGLRTSTGYSYHGASSRNVDILTTPRGDFNFCDGITVDACTCSAAPTAATTVAPDSSDFTDVDAICEGKGGMFQEGGGRTMKVCWTKSGEDKYKFWMRMTGAPGYVALGFSTDAKMPGTDIYWLDSRQEDAGGGMSTRYASAQATPAIETEPTGYLQNLVRQQQTTADGAVVQYSWERPVAGAGNRVPFGDDDEYFLLFAMGATESKHTNKGASGGRVLLSSTTAVGAEETKFSSTHKIVHGAMMVLAWVFLSPVASFTARFSKRIVEPIWFKMHMYMQISAVFLTIVATIIVSQDELVDYNELVDRGCDDTGAMQCSSTHAQLGVAICVLALFQVFLGIFRKKISKETPETKKQHPHGPRRWLFNYMHWTTGLVLLLTTLVNVAIGLGLNDDWVKKPASRFFLTVVIIGVACFLLIEAVRLRRKQTGSKHGQLEDSLTRHLYALMASSALAGAVTIIVVIADSDDV
eukprot:m.241753 g.241753  ORF g.241753 m.241753 type:complete len:634 (+) comp19422_c0_seq1:174-2075(+)